MNFSVKKFSKNFLLKLTKSHKRNKPKYFHHLTDLFYLGPLRAQCLLWYLGILGSTVEWNLLKMTFKILNLQDEFSFKIEIHRTNEIRKRLICLSELPSRLAFRKLIWLLSSANLKIIRKKTILLNSKWAIQLYWLENLKPTLRHFATPSVQTGLTFNNK